MKKILLIAPSMWWWLQSPDSFYNEQSEFINSIEANTEMESIYKKWLEEYLSKKYEEWWDEQILEIAKALWNAKDLKNYLDFLLKNAQTDKRILDDISQLARLKNKLSDLKEETELLWPKDFEIIWGRRWSYEFVHDDFEYIWNNRYKVEVNFQKRQNKLITYGRNEQFFIEYAWKNTIKYYNQNERFLWIWVIDHKQEEKTIVDISGNRIEQTKYGRGVEQSVYLPELRVHLTMKFHEK